MAGPAAVAAWSESLFPAGMGMRVLRQRAVESALTAAAHVSARRAAAPETPVPLPEPAAVHRVAAATPRAERPPAAAPRLPPRAAGRRPGEGRAPPRAQAGRPRGLGGRRLRGRVLPRRPSLPPRGAPPEPGGCDRNRRGPPRSAAAAEAAAAAARHRRARRAPRQRAGSGGHAWRPWPWGSSAAEAPSGARPPGRGYQWPQRRRSTHSPERAPARIARYHQRSQSGSSLLAPDLDHLGLAEAQVGEPRLRKPGEGPAGRLGDLPEQLGARRRVGVLGSARPDRHRRGPPLHGRAGHLRRGLEPCRRRAAGPGTPGGPSRRRRHGRSARPITRPSSATSDPSTAAPGAGP